MTKEEETEEEETTEEETKEDTLEETRAVISELKEQNKILETILDRAEKLEAENLLGGNAIAGKTTEKKERLNDRAYADAMENGEVDPFKEDGYN